MPEVMTSPAAEAVADESYGFLRNYVYDASGIVLEGDKRYLVEARLMPIVVQRKLGTLESLCALLRATQDGELKREVVDAMTTNETYFFRDNPQYEALKNDVLPALIAQRQSSRTLSFWSAACSAGQEAYSLAIMLLEMGLGNWNIEILGTDLSGQVLERARTARYMQIEVNRGLPASYLVKYFKRAGLEWQLNDEVRRMVKFQPIDLRQDMSALGPFDIVFCRNVLIYFDIECKKKILAAIRGTLRPGGYLLLGGSETTLNLDRVYEPRNFGKTQFYQTPQKG